MRSAGEPVRLRSASSDGELWAESRVRTASDERIEAAVQVAVVAAERTAHEETLGRSEPALLGDIEDAADAIRARYEVLIQHEVEAPAGAWRPVRLAPVEGKWSGSGVLSLEPPAPGST
jgi:hypothetical protein